MKPTDYKLVMITWSDAESNDTWVELKEITEDKQLHVCSIGWLVADKPDRLVIIASMDLSNEKDMVSGHVTIPKAMVHEVKELQIKKSKIKKVKVLVEDPDSNTVGH